MPSKKVQRLVESFRRALNERPVIPADPGTLARGGHIISGETEEDEAILKASFSKPRYMPPSRKKVFHKDSPSAYSNMADGIYRYVEPGSPVIKNIKNYANAMGIPNPPETTMSHDWEGNRIYTRIKEEVYTLEELNEAFNALRLDTEKYTTEYLAEELGFQQISEGKLGDSLKRFVMPALFAANTAMSGGAMMNNINAVDQLKDNIRTQVYQDVDTELQDNEDRALANANAIMSFSKPGSYQHELAKETIEAIRQGGPGKKTANTAPSSGDRPQYTSFDTEDVISGKVKPITTGRKYIQPRNAGTVDVFDNEDIDAEIASRIKSDETTKSLQRQAGNSALVGMASAGLAAGTAGKEIFDGKKPLVGSDVELPKVKLGKEENVSESYTLSELNEAFNALGLNTKKYTTEYLAKELGFKRK